jgi:membrane protein implicated in regulation of membrane protease activity
MTWLYWILLGLGLAIFEIVTPGGLFALFFAVSAIAVGLVSASGIGLPDWAEWALFSIVAVACLALFRRPLLARLRAKERKGDVDSMAGELVSPVASIEPGHVGRAELRGSTWSARNIDAAVVAAGQRCRVVAVRGLELDIRSE